MHRETASQRKAWTEFVTGQKEQKPCRTSKYGNRRVEFNGKMYDSLREANHAAKLQMLERAGKICDLKEQHRIVLVQGDGKLRPIVYVADFTYIDESGFHVVDAKGAKTALYRLKKKLAALILRIQIEEV